MKNTETNPLNRAIAKTGLSKLAKHLGVTYQAIYKWQSAGRLPLTELSCETAYARTIEIITDGLVTQNELLDWSFPTRLKNCDCTNIGEHHV